MYLCLYLSSIYAHHYIHISLPVFSASTSNLAIICLSVSNLYSSIYIINVCIPMVIYLYNYHLSIHPSTYLCIIYIYCLSISVIICLLSIVHPSIFLSFVCLYLFIYLYLSSVYPPAYLSRLSVSIFCVYYYSYLCIHPFIYHLCLSVYIIYMSIIITCLPVYPSIHPIYLSVACLYLSPIYIPPHLSIHPRVTRVSLQRSPNGGPCRPSQGLLGVLEQVSPTPAQGQSW